jgi:3'(2'), 5'-bisphosphate nucleotidase
VTDPLPNPSRATPLAPGFRPWWPAIDLVAVATQWAARFAEQLAGQADGSGAKSDASPVTAADLALQAFIGQSLAGIDGGVSLVGEESSAIFGATDAAAARGDSALFRRTEKLASTIDSTLRGTALIEAIDRGTADGRAREQWVVDPIDGTRGYLRGLQYCVCLAFIRDGVPIVGIAGCPRLGPNGMLIAAVRGVGVLQWQLDALDAPPTMPRASNARSGTIVACESTGVSDRARERLRRIAETLGEPLIVRPMESQCKFALVATGDADLAIRLASANPNGQRDMIWDYAGAVVFAEESGARMTDCDGRPLRFGEGRSIAGTRGVLCSASWLHARTVEACRSVDRLFGVPVPQLEAATAASLDSGASQRAE